MKLSQTRIDNFESFRELHKPSTDQQIFKFLLLNNNLFGQINIDDQQKIQQISVLRFNSSLNAFYLTILFIFITDKYIFKSFSQQVNNKKPYLMVVKYIGFPIITAYGVLKYYQNQGNILSQQLMNKYQFNISHYNKALDLMEQAHKQNKLKEFYKFGFKMYENEKQ